MTSTAEFWVGPDDAPDTYQLSTTIGGGGEGDVWRAVVHLSDAGRTEVAVKDMPQDGYTREEWSTYGHLLTALAHPGLVRVQRVFMGAPYHRWDETPTLTPTSERRRYVVMDYVNGPNLLAYVGDNPTLTSAERIRLLRTAAAALDEMHSGRRTGVPVAHGDVKPSNILVPDGVSTVLVDLGLARLSDGPGRRGVSKPYAAPELRGGGAEATPESDAYAFVVTTAVALTGATPPIDHEGFLDLQGLHTLLTTNEVTRPRIRLIDSIMSALAGSPSERPRLLGPWLDGLTEALSQLTDPNYGGIGAPTAEIAAVAGAPVVPGNDPIVTPAPKRWTGKRLGILAAVVVLVLAGGGTAVAIGMSGGDTPSGGSSPTDLAAQTPSVSDTPTVSDTPSLSDTPTESDSASATDSGSPSDTASSTDGPTESGTASGGVVVTGGTFLSNVSPVDYDNIYGGDYDNGSYDTNGVTYGHSLLMKSGCEDGGDMWVEYDTGRSFSTFNATIGVSDDSTSGATGSWFVFADGKKISSGGLALGSSKPVTLNISGVLRLRLQITLPLSVNGCQSSDVDMAVVWGNAQIS